LKTPKIIAHRGASFVAPENTLASVNLAWEQNCTHVEVDVKLSKDNEIVVFHDETTERYNGKDSLVNTYTFKELQSMDVGSFKGDTWKNEPVPSLEQVLQTIPAKGTLVVELKDGPEMEQPLVNLARKYPKLWSQLEFISFNYDSIAMAKRQFPKNKCLWLLDLDYDEETAKNIPSNPYIINQVQQANLDGVDVFAGKVANATFFKAMQHAGLQVYLWTINQWEHAQQYLIFAPDGITTDKPKWMQQKLNQTMEHKLSQTEWDLLIIGGGATGMGCAIDAAARGYKTLLVEKEDYGKGTSSKSTKLIHGGVRYLQQGNVSLVLEALKERALLKNNAPHLVHDLEFVVPTYDWWESPFYGIGLKMYDWLAGKEGFGDSKLLSKEETIELLPTITQKDLRGGVIYHDGQFDDTRLLINMMQTAKEQGATVINYHEFLGFTKNEDGIINGGKLLDRHQNKEFQIKAKAVINATGVYSDSIRTLDDQQVSKIMTSSQGVHIVLDKSFLPGETAIMIPETDDGRVLFAVPWHDKIIVGTTDTLVEDYPYEPLPKEEEIDFLLTHTAKYLTKDPTKADVKSVFVGLRPLVKSGNAEDTKSISREHVIEVSANGLVSIAGGKWTTYRKMAEDTIDKAAMIAGLANIKSQTEYLNIHGHKTNIDPNDFLGVYGTDAALILSLAQKRPELNQVIHPNHPIIKAQVVWAILHEDAKTIEDFLARRTRLLFLDARASIEAAPVVAEIFKQELNLTEAWKSEQIASFTQLAEQYLLR